MKSVALFSGGKDSFLSALIASEQGLDVSHCVTIDPAEHSMMFHYPNTRAADLSAKLLGLGVKHVREERFAAELASLEKDGVQAVISGAIASEYQKTRIERLCTELGLVSYTPLWRKRQDLVLKKVIESGMKAMVVSVSAEGLGEGDLGTTINSDFIEKMAHLNDRIGINMAGEGGEYETYVFGLEGRGMVSIDSSNLRWQGSGGYLLIESAHFLPPGP